MIRVEFRKFDTTERLSLADMPGVPRSGEMVHLNDEAWQVQQVLWWQAGGSEWQATVFVAKAAS